VANPDRLSGLDSSFLGLERDTAHMHVAACALFEGAAPRYEYLIAHIRSRLHLVPRFRQRLAFVPLGLGRPVWVDDPHFNLGYHVRHTALPRPGSDEELKRLAGRVFSQALDRSRPLWELWLVEGLAENRFALLSKTHHALVDGISSVDIATVLFDTKADPPSVGPAEGEWAPRPMPTRVQLVADALQERLSVPGAIVRGAESTARAPRRTASRIGGALAGVTAIASAGLRSAPPTPFNVRIGPHRRFTWVRSELTKFKQVKQALGGTVNDVVLAVVAGALGRYMRLHGDGTDEVVLKAMVPVSIRAGTKTRPLGNHVAAMWAPLPIGIMDPIRRLQQIQRAMAGIKESGQAIGAQVLTQLTGFAPATIIAQAARLQTRQRFFNLVVTNVPGPQFPLYMLGHELNALFPMVPLTGNTALAIAIISYNGQLNFGVTADYDALADVETLAAELRSSIEEMVGAGGASGRKAVGATPSVSGS
jgi:WS/DGAT/MGAT family acyltransferase